LNSLYEQKKVTYENVIKILNVLDYDYYFQLTEAFLSEDVPRSFVILDDILSRGFNLQSFVEGLAIHFRDLLVSKDQATVSLLETSDNIKERYKQMAQKCPLEFLYDCLEILNECELYLRDKKNPRLFTEIAFVKLCRQINKKKTIANSYSENSVKNDNSSNDGKTIKPVVEPTNISPKKTEVIVSTPIKPPISSPSLKNIINNLSSSRNEQNNVEEPKEVLKNEDTNKRNKPFTPTLLINQYNSFIESIRNEMPRMYSNLHQIPTVKDNIIEIVLPNQNAIEDFVHKLKAKLTNFLRDKVENDYIEISIELEKTEDKKLLYTSEEKFQYMVSKNPNLLVFKQKFDLDFE